MAASSASVLSRFEPRRLADLVTPCALIDVSLVEKNVRKMNASAAKAGAPLRPHVKTVKSIELAKLMTASHPGGITVSTLAEARYFGTAGYTDILYAVGIAPAKLPEVADLRRQGIDLKIILDSPEAATAVRDWSMAQRVPLSVLAEIDADGHRGGFDPGSAELLEAARILHGCEFTHFAGVMTHAGGSYDCRGKAALQAMAVQERDAVLVSAEQLAQANISCDMISVGSTPTALNAPSLAPATEIRAGVYPFMDLYQAGLGLCEPEDIALSVLATVIGHKPRFNRLLVDAGALALSKDRGTGAQEIDRGFGLVCGLDGTVCGRLLVETVNQEHGLVTSADGSTLDFAAWPIGSQLRILPNHACMTAAAYDAYLVLGRQGDTVEARWPRCGGWGVG
ncbi:MAG: alanine racemase [Pseudomonadota bacterium]